MIASKNRFVPLALGPKTKVKNRVVIPAMASESADPQGFATERTIAHYRRIAEAGAGLVFVEYTFVHRSGRSEPNQLGADADGHIHGLGQIADAIRAAGSIPGLQLTHAGGKTERQYSNGRIFGPSGIAVPVKGRTLEAPEAMSDADIELWRESFEAAAARGIAAGFEVLELHAAHGYGLNQWLSPLTNRREDAFGGTVVKRAKLLLDIVRSIRARFPDVVISVRMPGQDHLSGGMTTVDAIQTAELLANSGVSIISVSSGLGGWRRPIQREGEGYLVAEAAKFQAALDIPVIGVGGIETAAYIEHSLANRFFELAAVGRAILSDPVAWSRRNLTSLNADHASHL